MDQGNWQEQLERPSEAFFKAFASRLRSPDGAIGAAREAVLKLVPLVDWPAYLPHVPHGLLGLQAVFRLRPLLATASFQRILATQLHGFALEVRSAGHGLAALGTGSGHWGNLEMAVRGHRPAIAWGEALAMAAPTAADFRRLEDWSEADMANVGHKAVMAQGLAELAGQLDEVACSRHLLALSAWLCASEPFDSFWRDRALSRLGAAAPVPTRPATLDPGQLRDGVREICDSGLVDLLDRFTARVRSAPGSGDLLAMLVLAAAEKQLDARRDLEGRTAWTFVFLASLARRADLQGAVRPESWVQAAALVNLFPTGEDEDRARPLPPRQPVADPGAGLLDAILDGEPAQAMHFARELRTRSGAEAVLRVLAEAASDNDPTFNHSHQILAVAAAAELLPRLAEPVQEALLLAMAKFLGNAQGSTDLGRLAAAALSQPPPVQETP